MASLFKKGIKLANKERKNTTGAFAARWKRRLSITAKKAMMSLLAHHALRTCLRDELEDYVDEDTMSDL